MFLALRLLAVKTLHCSSPPQQLPETAANMLQHLNVLSFSMYSTLPLILRTACLNCLFICLNRMPQHSNICFCSAQSALRELHRLLAFPEYNSRPAAWETGLCGPQRLNASR